VDYELTWSVVMPLSFLSLWNWDKQVFYTIFVGLSVKVQDNCQNISKATIVIAFDIFDTWDHHKNILKGRGVFFMMSFLSPKIQNRR